MPLRAAQILYKGTVSGRSKAYDLLFKAADYVIVERGHPLLIVMRCPCGCGDDLLINLDKRAGPAWRFYQRKSGNSLYPSYWRSSECRSHFIIWNDRIYWCSIGDGDEDDEDEEYRSIDDDVEHLVLETLTEQYVHYIDIADECGLIPWECLQACRQLESRGLCQGGRNDQRGCFKLVHRSSS